MHAFKDTAERAWLVEINVAAVKRVRTLLGLDLYGLIDDGAKPLGELLGDPCRLVDVLFVLCAEQAKRDGVSDEDFGRAFSGDVLEAAGDAFFAELVDFFPKREARQSLLKVAAKGKKLGLMLLAKADAQLDALDLDSLAATLTGSSGAVPGSSASTPAP